MNKWPITCWKQDLGKDNKYGLEKRTRKTSVAFFYLNAVHDYLAANIWRINIYSSSEYNEHNTRMDKEHLLHRKKLDAD